MKVVGLLGYDPGSLTSGQADTDRAPRKETAISFL